MSSDEFRSLVIGKTEFEATSQTNMVYQAITYARLFNQKMVKGLGTTVLGEAKDDEPDGTTTTEDILNFDRDKPIPFLLSEFIKHLDKVQGQKAWQIRKFSCKFWKR
jgi:hypothetical protein